MRSLLLALTVLVTALPICLSREFTQEELREELMSRLLPEKSGPSDLPTPFFTKESCADIMNFDCGDSNGVHELLIDGRRMSVYCDQATDGGGWTVIQRRVDNSTNFYRNWEDYEEGFGDMDGNFWIGLKKLYNMMTIQGYTLRVDMTDFDDWTAYAYYSWFKVGPAADYYRLSISGYEGTAGDSLKYANKQRFSTKDKDNDATSTYDCAEGYVGAWWYKGCGDSNLNGKIRNRRNIESVYWYSWKNDYHPLKSVEMKIRPRVIREFDGDIFEHQWYTPK